MTLPEISGSQTPPADCALETAAQANTSENRPRSQSAYHIKFARCIQSWNELDADDPTYVAEREGLAVTITEFASPPLAEAVRLTEGLLKRTESVDEDDLRQEGLISIFDGLAKYDPNKSSTYGYCLMVASCGILDWLKKPAIMGRNYERTTESLYRRRRRGQGWSRAHRIDGLPTYEFPFEDEAIERLTREELVPRQQVAILELLTEEGLLSAFEVRVVDLILMRYSEIKGSDIRVESARLGKFSGTSAKQIDNGKEKAFKKIRVHPRGRLLRQLLPEHS